MRERSRAPARAPTPAPAPEAEKLTCFTGMPEQSCNPGCDADEYGCAGDCGSQCLACTKAQCENLDGDAYDDCEATCIANNDRCVTGDCGKKRAECERREGAEIKKNYGCKKKDLFEACGELMTCMGDSECESKGNCAKVCERKTGCDAAFQKLVEWDGSLRWKP